MIPVETIPVIVWEEESAVNGVNSSTINLIHCRTFANTPMYPTSTIIVIIKRI
jgi:hypothetical protein